MKYFFIKVTISPEISFLPHVLCTMRFLFVLLVLAVITVCCRAQNNTDSGDVIAETSIPVRKAPYEQHHRDVVGSLTGVFCGILHLVIFIFVIRNADLSDRARTTLILMMFLGLAGFILFELEFFLNMWDTYVQRTKWDRETFIVANTTVKYFTCANVVCNHGCANVPPGPGVGDCNFMQSQLTPGACNGGYKCCNSVRYGYPCGSSKTPRTCYYSVCVNSVSSLWCDVIVGFCADVQSIVYYTAKDGRRFYTTYHQHCGLNDSRCVSELVDEFKNGYSFRASINPEAPENLVEDISYSTEPLVGMIFGAVFLSISYIVLVIILSWDYIRDCECNIPSCPDCSCFTDFFARRNQNATITPPPAEENPPYPSAPPAYEPYVSPPAYVYPNSAK